MPDSEVSMPVEINLYSILGDPKDTPMDPRPSIMSEPLTDNRLLLVLPLLLRQQVKAFVSRKYPHGGRLFQPRLK